MGLQIRGLVKAFRTIRSALQVGLAPSEVEHFKNQIGELLGQVEEICSMHQATPNDLPTPSRNAYFFLKEVDLESLPLRDEGVALPSASSLHISNVVKTGEQLAARIWQRVDLLLDSSERRTLFLSQMARHSNTIERLCAEHQATPASLAKPSRLVYCWLKFLSSPPRFEQHLRTLRRIRELAAPFLDSLGEISMEIHLVHLGSLWRLAPYQNGLRLRCSEALLLAPDEVWNAIFGSMLSKKTKHRKRVITEFLQTEAYSSVMFELQSFIEHKEASKGIVYDLSESFDRVNTAYFGGMVAKPHLHWSQTPTTSKFGHYQFSTDTIMLSTTLDSVDVPEFVLDFVMYHEMLHKVHGVQIVDGRRRAHTPAFRKDEKAFKQYEEAELFLIHLAS